MSCWSCRNGFDDAGGRQMGSADVGVSLLYSLSPPLSQGFARGSSAHWQSTPLTNESETRLYGRWAGEPRWPIWITWSGPVGLPGCRATARRAIRRGRPADWRILPPCARAQRRVPRLLLLQQGGPGPASAMVVQLADERGLGLWRALGSIYAGWSRAESGARAPKAWR